MEAEKLLVERFEANRTHLRAVAYRMLGSNSDADDAVQEAWLRLGRADTGDVGNLVGWLTTVVARVCLDMLRRRRSRREEPLEVLGPEPVASDPNASAPDEQILMADSVGPALLVVLEALAPAERVAFALHDMFAMPFDEIAPIVGRSPAAARQLASRARRRVQRSATVSATDPSRQRRVVEAFLAASRDGDLAALLSVLDPEIVMRADATAVTASNSRHAKGAPALSSEIRGAAAVAKTFAGRAQAAEPALIDGGVGLVWAPGGQPRAAFRFTLALDRVVEIDLIMDPERLSRLHLVLFDG